MVQAGPDSVAVEDEEVDVSLRDSRSTVQLPQQGVFSGETTTLGTNPRAESTHENLEAMMSYLLNEMKVLKLQLGGQSLPKVESLEKSGLEDHVTSSRLEEEDLDNASSVSSEAGWSSAGRSWSLETFEDSRDG